jgi:hypothetical protein
VRRFGDDLGDLRASAYAADGTQRTTTGPPTQLQGTYNYGTSGPGLRAAMEASRSSGEQRGAPLPPHPYRSAQRAGLLASGSEVPVIGRLALFDWMESE